MHSFLKFDGLPIWPWPPVIHWNILKSLHLIVFDGSWKAHVNQRYRIGGGERIVGKRGKNYKLQNTFIENCDKVQLLHGCYRRTVVISSRKRPASDEERWETAVLLGWDWQPLYWRSLFFLTDSSSQLATWEIILIITGVVLFLILVILVIFLVSIHKNEQYFVINHLLTLHFKGFIPVAREKLWCACAEEVIPLTLRRVTPASLSWPKYCVTRFH